MKIGIVTTWFERGAAYVSRAYRDSLVAEGHQVYIYARGGEQQRIKDPKWSGDYVTWGYSLQGHDINDRHFFKWIEDKDLEAIFFNEQTFFRTVALTKKKYPNIKLGSYIDYYTETTLPFFNIYDFVICNTKRHLEALDQHPNAYYVKWGTDVDLFKPTRWTTEVTNEELSKKDVGKTHCEINRVEKVVFFHSAGMSARKGTDVLVDAFIDGKLYEKSKLIIHTQVPIERLCRYNKETLEEYSIEVIEKTVTAPGLYHLGDVYVYPTRLDGLGLTMYEALSCGMPVITTDYPPMNEVIDENVGRLVRVARNYAREDAYYWPMSICDKESLKECMESYINDSSMLAEQRRNARAKALAEYDWSKKSKEISDIFLTAPVLEPDEELMERILKVGKMRHFKDMMLQHEVVVKLRKMVKGR